MPIIDAPKCNLLYSKDAGSASQPRTIKDDMLCAGLGGKKDACKVGTEVGGPRLGPAPWAAQAKLQPTWDRDKAQEVGPQGPGQELCIQPAGK